MPAFVKVKTPNGDVYVNMDTVLTMKERKASPGGTIFLFEKEHTMSCTTSVNDILMEITRLSSR